MNDFSRYDIEKHFLADINAFESELSNIGGN